jgi:hypothetical protein
VVNKRFNDSSTATLRYDMDPAGGNDVLLNYNVIGTGSGSSDLNVYIPVSDFTNAPGNDYIYLYAHFGGYTTSPFNFSSDSGYEEWRFVPGTGQQPPPAVPLPSTAWMGLTLPRGIGNARIQCGAMLSRRFTILSTFSAICCVLCAAMWVRSFWASDGIARVSQRKGVVTILYNKGVLYAMLMPDYVTTWDPGLRFARGPSDVDIGERSSHRSFLGFQFRLYDRGNSLRFIGVPFWFPTLITVVLPCIWFVRRERARRIRLGLCVSCCRDLTNCTGTCPDCGAPIATRTIISGIPNQSSQTC